jgi:hypothetical protein
VEQLCCEEANHFTADVTLKFMLNELVEQNNDLIIALKNSLIICIKERRTACSDVLYFLHDPKKNYEEDYGIFYKTNKTIIVEIIERISAKNIIIDEPEPECSASTSAAPVVAAIPISMKEKLQLAIKKKPKLL